MSTEIETLAETYLLNEYWGGDNKGVCLQVTRVSGEEPCIQLTMEEAAILANDLVSFVKSEAKRRQGLLAEQLKELTELNGTVFNEVAELDETMFDVQQTCVMLVSKFAPKARNK